MCKDGHDPFAATGAIWTDSATVESLNRASSFRIDVTCVWVGVKVTEIGTDHDERIFIDAFGDKLLCNRGAVSDRAPPAVTRISVAPFADREFVPRQNARRRVRRPVSAHRRKTTNPLVVQCL